MNQNPSASSRSPTLSKKTCSGLRTGPQQGSCGGAWRRGRFTPPNALPRHKPASNPPAGDAILRQEKIYAKHALQPAVRGLPAGDAAVPPCRRRAAPKRDVVPLTITVQEAEPGQMLRLGSRPDDGDPRVGALICRPLAEQAVDRNKPGGGLRLDVPLEWLDGYVAARSGKEDLPFRLWQQGGQWTSSLIRLRDACAAAPHGPPGGTLADGAGKAVAANALPALPQLPPAGRKLAAPGPLVGRSSGLQGKPALSPLELGSLAAQSDALLDWCGKHPGKPLQKALEQLAAPRRPPRLAEPA